MKFLLVVTPPFVYHWWSRSWTFTPFLIYIPISTIPKYFWACLNQGVVPLSPSIAFYSYFLLLILSQCVVCSHYSVFLICIAVGISSSCIWCVYVVGLCCRSSGCWTKCCNSSVFWSSIFGGILGKLSGHSPIRYWICMYKNMPMWSPMSKLKDMSRQVTISTSSDIHTASIFTIPQHHVFVSGRLGWIYYSPLEITISFIFLARWTPCALPLWSQHMDIWVYNWSGCWGLIFLRSILCVLSLQVIY